MSAADKIAEAHPPQMWAACEWCVEHRNEEAVTIPDEIRWDGQKWSCEDCWDPEDDGWDRALKASDLADAQAQENARLKMIIARMDGAVPVADKTCDQPGITLSEAVMRQWPELRAGSGR